MSNENRRIAEVVPFCDGDTNTFSYVVKDPSSMVCAIVDSVLNFDYTSHRAIRPRA
ncbi:MAG: hypothetical protein WC997_06960 [Porticoccaceae bacterium]